jgi:hypothetical protein
MRGMLVGDVEVDVLEDWLLRYIVKISSQDLLAKQIWHRDKTESTIYRSWDQSIVKGPYSRVTEARQNGPKVKQHAP